MTNFYPQVQHNNEYSAQLVFCLAISPYQYVQHSNKYTAQFLFCLAYWPWPFLYIHTDVLTFVHYTIVVRYRNNFSKVWITLSTKLMFLWLVAISLPCHSVMGPHHWRADHTEQQDYEIIWRFWGPENSPWSEGAQQQFVHIISPHCILISPKFSVISFNIYLTCTLYYTIVIQHALYYPGSTLVHKIADSYIANVLQI